MTEPDPCAHCGKDAFAKVDMDGGSSRYGSERHDMSRFVTVDSTATQGPICDDCLDLALTYGRVVKTSDVDGLRPPSALGRRGAVALFLRGFRHASQRADSEWEADATRGVVLHVDGGACSDATLDPVPLPGWMVAAGRLWLALSATGTGNVPNETDFESMGALFFLMAQTRVDDLKSEDIRKAAEEAFDRELKVEAQVEVMRDRHDARVGEPGRPF